MYVKLLELKSSVEDKVNKVVLLVIYHITLTSDEISFQGILLSLYLSKSSHEGPSHWKGTLDGFYARTACHSALATTQNRKQITENFTGVKLY